VRHPRRTAASIAGGDAAKQESAALDQGLSEPTTIRCFDLDAGAARFAIAPARPAL